MRPPTYPTATRIQLPTHPPWVLFQPACPSTYDAQFCTVSYGQVVATGGRNGRRFWRRRGRHRRDNADYPCVHRRIAWGLEGHRRYWRDGLQGKLWPKAPDKRKAESVGDDHRGVVVLVRVLIMRSL